MNILTVLTTVCIILFGLFGAFAILTKKGDQQANILLGTFFLLWALDFLDGLLMLSGFYLNHTYLALWNESFVFLYGPILYFYSLRIVKGKSVFNWKSLLHLIPFIVTTLLISFSFHLQSEVMKADILRNVINQEQSPQVYLIGIIVCVHFFSYIFLSKRAIRKREKELNSFYSNYNIQWLNTILNYFIIILIVSITASILQFKQSNLYFEIGLPGLLIALMILIITVFWKSLNESSIWLIKEDIVKYSRTQIVDEEKMIIYEKINKALKEDKIYLNPDLTLEDLSKHLGYSDRKISQVINELINKSFFDLINTYRIEAAKVKFRNNQDSKLTILEVMYEVGFNSKSSFNTQFKKRVGLTPTEFIKSN